MCSVGIRRCLVLGTGILEGSIVVVLSHGRHTSHWGCTTVSKEQHNSWTGYYCLIAAPNLLQGCHNCLMGGTSLTRMAKLPHKGRISLPGAAQLSHKGGASLLGATQLYDRGGRSLRVGTCSTILHGQHIYNCGGKQPHRGGPSPTGRIKLSHRGGTSPNVAATIS